jgi:psp operon transcriptional activator
VAAPAAAAAPPRPSFPIDFQAEVARHETGLIESALQEARYNQKDAAMKLGLTYHQLRGLLRKYKLSGAEP